MTLDAVADLRDGSDASAKEKRLKCYRSAAFTEEYLASCLVELRQGGSGTVPRASSSRMISSPENSVEEPAEVPTLDTPEPAKKKHATSTLLRSQDDHTDYQCSVCGEAFLTYQALGGHKTIHRFELSTVTVTVPDEPSAASSTGNAPTPNVSAPSKSNPRDKAHVCFICHMSFPKGQYLVGHMSRHYNGRIRRFRPRAKTTVPNTTTFFPSSEDGVSIKKHHHDFDLNLSPPPPEPAEHELDLELRLNF